jgi:hypothetical protein
MEWPPSRKRPGRVIADEIGVSAEALYRELAKPENVELK